MKYFKSLFLPVLCAVCFSGCGVIEDNGTDNMNASEETTPASNIAERTEEQTTAFQAEITFVSDEKTQNDTDNLDSRINMTMLVKLLQEPYKYPSVFREVRQLSLSVLRLRSIQ